MQVVIAKKKAEKKKFIQFRKKIYRNNPNVIDNNIYMIKQVFASKTCFIDSKVIIPIYIEEDNQIKCECLAIYAKDLPEYIQLCFFESKENVIDAVKMLVDKVIEIGKEYGCTKLVVGLNGHINYGLGLQNSHFDARNTFGASCNPKFYNDYFKEMNYDEILLNTYLWEDMTNQFNKYARVLNKLNNSYTFKFLEKSKLDYYSKIYTDLNNECFSGHRYYYKRNYEEDKEMLKELLLFMKPDSLIFAFKDDKPVGFILWYQDFNELASPKEEFGVKTYIKNLFFNKKIKSGKIVEIAVSEEHRKHGLALALLHQVYFGFARYGLKTGESSWILDENTDSNSICRICIGKHKGYVVYEKDI